jgi:hypothetical protein
MIRHECPFYDKFYLQLILEVRQSGGALSHFYKLSQRIYVKSYTKRRRFRPRTKRRNVPQMRGKPMQLTTTMVTKPISKRT